MKYTLMYRFGATPWERYATVAATSIGAKLDRERLERPDTPGRALDLGCGRGVYSRELSRRGWDVVGVDIVPRAIDAAMRAGGPSVTYIVGDVTRLAAADLGTFDLFLDIGCFQGLNSAQRGDEGRVVTSLARPDATILMLAFGPTALRSFVEGVSRAEVGSALPQWDLLSAEPAVTRGLGWPMNRTSPQWFRLRRRT